MSDLLILISSCILSSVITILMATFVKHLQYKDYKKKVGVLFNLVKKNRPKHYNTLKNIFISHNIEVDDLEHKLTKLLNLESIFFMEIFKSLLDDKSYNLNIIYRSYSELITYTELFLSESFIHNVSKNSLEEKGSNNIVMNNIKLNLSQSNNPTQLSINNLREKFYNKKDLENTLILFQDEIDNPVVKHNEDIIEEIMQENFSEESPSELEFDIDTHSTTNAKDNNQEERVLIEKNLTDHLEEV